MWILVGKVKEEVLKKLIALLEIIVELGPINIHQKYKIAVPEICDTGTSLIGPHFSPVVFESRRYTESYYIPYFQRKHMAYT